MIELPDELSRALRDNPDGTVLLIDPATQRTFVLVRVDEYERLKEDAYDASPWTDEEMDLLAAEDADSLGWDGMDAYQGPESRSSTAATSRWRVSPTRQAGEARNVPWP